MIKWFNHCLAHSEGPGFGPGSRHALRCFVQTRRSPLCTTISSEIAARHRALSFGTYPQEVTISIDIGRVMSTCKSFRRRELDPGLPRDRRKY